MCLRFITIELKRVISDHEVQFIEQIARICLFKSLFSCVLIVKYELGLVQRKNSFVLECFLSHSKSTNRDDFRTKTLGSTCFML